MPNREELQQTLQRLRDVKWVESRLNRLARMPGKRREALRDLIQQDKNVYDEGRFAARVNATASYFDTLGDKQRRKLWNVLFPRLAPHMERAWRDTPLRPYPSGFQRFPFRAPSREDTSRQSRARFFLNICEGLRGLDEDAEWLAAWAPHLGPVWRDQRVIGWLLAAVLRGGGDDAARVRSVLEQSIAGTHEIGEFSEHAIVALLNSDEREDWGTVGRLLLAAQRQEGLRQTILESVDEAHPKAFRYMLGLILEHDLQRFSATVRAFDVWLGTQWAAGSTKVVRDGVHRLCELFDDTANCDRALGGDNAEDAYLALWVLAYGDAEQALRAAAPLLEHERPEFRYVAVRAISRIILNPGSLDLIAAHLISGRESDERVLMAVAEFLAGLQYEQVSDELFDAVATLFENTPVRKKKLKPIVWPWAEHTADRRTVASALKALAMRDTAKLIPFAPALDSSDCLHVIYELAGLGQYWDHGNFRQRARKKLTPAARAFVVEMTSDGRQAVQAAAFQALEGSEVTEDEVERYLANLHRSAASLRQGAIGRLATLPAKRVLEISERLLDDKHPKKRAAGLELASQLVETGKSAARARSLVERHRDGLTDRNLAQTVEHITDGTVETHTLDDCLGLVPEGSRSKLAPPTHAGVAVKTKASELCLKDLAELFLEHGETEIALAYGDLGAEGAKSHAHLAAAGWGFPRPKPDTNVQADARERLPLAEVWLDWLANRDTAARDEDGLELVRAWIRLSHWVRAKGVLPAAFDKQGAWDLNRGFESLVEWMVLLSEPEGAGAYLVQFAEDALAKGTPMKVEASALKQANRFMPNLGLASMRFQAFSGFERLGCPHVTRADRARIAVLEMIALEHAHRGCNGPSIKLFADAHEEGLLNEHDLIWLLLHPRKQEKHPGFYYGPSRRFGPIREASGLRPPKEIASHPGLLDAVQRVRDRLIEVELTRGERVTVASVPAAELGYSGGSEVLVRLVTALGKDKIIRQDQWGEPTRAYSFSRLMSVTAPAPGDSPERFADKIDEAGIKPARVIELAMFAPQWAAFAEHATGFEGLEDAVWWIHAHTKQNQYWRDQAIREHWAAQINERTQLEADALEEGAVDVTWFARVIDTIGTEGWDRLQKPAKYASNSGGHKRAQLFADAMLGSVSSPELIARIDEKRHQDSVRAVGLVPLPTAEQDAKREILKRYQLLQEFKRQSRKFGSQRQASESRAVEIGMQNLARTAGYRDPRRLQWAMESEAVRDLAKGPVSVSAEETTVELAITGAGDPELTVVKKGRKLKRVPAKLRKHEPIAELRTRVTELRRQRSRMRQSLEESMCRGDLFSRAELAEFDQHPMLRPMVERLVFIGEGELIGYSEEGARVLRDHAGKVEPIGKHDRVRLAHPVDLLERGDWSAWQRECFAAERVQPFKQVFREVYPKTETELADCDMTRRYAGHQVNPRQALALLKQRQWVFTTEEGVSRVFHDEGIVADVWFQEHFHTPAEVEDLTVEGVGFFRRGERSKRLLMSNLPARLFSETMRDLDLVVSVAHTGGIDPEASASTVEMRATLLRETCQLLGLSNVTVEGHHAKIDGTKASYSVHLGSATARVMPGRILMIVAVHSQYRGRMFLPFADDDPKSAEVLAKSLLLARDDEIKDPSILSQIRG
ncbi:MAG: DUF5724 domain-containing protein [Phycisphaerales bacterium]